MGSEKSPLNSSDSSWASAFRAMTTNELESFVWNYPRGLTFKCLLDIDGLFSTSLEIWYSALGLTERHCSFGRYHPLILFDIDLVSQYHL